MSAVSSGSPQGSAEARQPVASREPGPDHQPASAPQQGAGHDPAADFGANEWLVEELYQRYLADPGSVDRAWWSFFADYQPALSNGTGPQPVLNVTATDRAGVREVRPAPGPQGAASRPRPRRQAAGRPRRPRPRRPRPPRLRRPPAQTPAAPASAAPGRAGGRGRWPAGPGSGAPGHAARSPGRTWSRGQQAARRRRPHRHQHDGQPRRAHGHQRPRDTRQAARG